MGCPCAHPTPELCAQRLHCAHTGRLPSWGGVAEPAGQLVVNLHYKGTLVSLLFVGTHIALGPCTGLNRLTHLELIMKTKTNLKAGIFDRPSYQG